MSSLRTRSSSRRLITRSHSTIEDLSAEEDCNNKSVLKPLRTSRRQTKTVSAPSNHNTSPCKNQHLSDDSSTECQFSPPKTPRKCSYKTPIPRTPNDKACIQIPLTPSRLMDRLSLTSPRKTHRKEVKDQFTDNESEESHDEKNICNVTPQKKQRIEDEENVCNKSKGTSRESAYKSARKALHSMYPVKMPGREEELKQLRQFICNHLSEGTSGTLYISGPPGTGKTAALNLVLQESEIISEVIHVYINCTSMKSSGTIYAKIASSLGLKLSKTTEKECLTCIENHLAKKHKTILLVLDEIDQLESKKQSILYTIFEWPSKPSSRLILIGIANALDLTDRILPRLQARCELKPKLMNFAPYTKQQIVDIFTCRLKEAGVIEVFSPAALQMLAAKVAAVSGDLRRALDIGRRVIELVDANAKEEDVFKSIENVEMGEEKAKPKSVDIKQVITTLNNVYGASQRLVEDIDDSFPLQQKVILCCLMLMLKKAKNKDVTIGKLHEVYRRVCTKQNLQAVDSGEFVGLCSLIETKGIIRLMMKKDSRMSKISLVWDEDEVAAVLRDKQLISSILYDQSCLREM